MPRLIHVRRKTKGAGRRPSSPQAGSAGLPEPPLAEDLAIVKARVTMTISAELPLNAWRALSQLAQEDGIPEGEALRRLMASEKLRRVLRTTGRRAATEVELDEEVLAGTEDLAPEYVPADRERWLTAAVVGIGVLVTVTAAWWLLATRVTPLTFAEVQAFSLALLAALGIGAIVAYHFPTRRRPRRQRKDRTVEDAEDE